MHDNLLLNEQPQVCPIICCSHCGKYIQPLQHSVTTYFNYACYCFKIGDSCAAGQNVIWNYNEPHPAFWSLIISPQYQIVVETDSTAPLKLGTHVFKLNLTPNGGLRSYKDTLVHLPESKMLDFSKPIDLPWLESWVETLVTFS